MSVYVCGQSILTARKHYKYIGLDSQVACHFFRCDLRLALCSLYLAFWRAEPEPWAPVTYFFFLALVFTLSSSFFWVDAFLKPMPLTSISSKSSM